MRVKRRETFLLFSMSLSTFTFTLENKKKVKWGALVFENKTISPPVTSIHLPSFGLHSESDEKRVSLWVSFKYRQLKKSAWRPFTVSSFLNNLRMPKASVPVLSFSPGGRTGSFFFGESELGGKLETLLGKSRLESFLSFSKKKISALFVNSSICEF